MKDFVLKSWVFAADIKIPVTSPDGTKSAVSVIERALKPLAGLEKPLTHRFDIWKRSELCLDDLTDILKRQSDFWIVQGKGSGISHLKWAADVNIIYGRAANLGMWKRAAFVAGTPLNAKQNSIRRRDLLNVKLLPKLHEAFRIRINHGIHELRDSADMQQTVYALSDAINGSAFRSAGRVQDPRLSKKGCDDARKRLSKSLHGIWDDRTVPHLTTLAGIQVMAAAIGMLAGIEARLSAENDLKLRRMYPADFN